MNGTAGRQAPNQRGAERAFTAPAQHGREGPELAAQVAALQTRWDLLIPSLATREHLAEGLGSVRAELLASSGAIRADVHKVQLSMIKWMAAFAIAVGSASVGAVKLLIDTAARTAPYAVVTDDASVVDDAQPFVIVGVTELP